MPERIRLPRQYLCVDDGQAGGRQAAGRQAVPDIVAPADFEDAFREHFAPVYRFIARRVGTALAEDLAAEAFATACRRWTSYEPSRASLRSWLYGIAANIMRGHWREEQQLLELEARLTAIGPQPASTGPFADAADERVIAASLAPRIAGALAALNAEQRDVLLLHAWADLSHEEIAAVLGIAPGTARSRLSRARTALRAHLGEFDFDLWTFKETAICRDRHPGGSRHLAAAQLPGPAGLAEEHVWPGTRRAHLSDGADLLRRGRQRVLAERPGGHGLVLRL